MHARSRVLLVAGALILAALTPHVIDDDSKVRTGTAVLASTDAPVEASERPVADRDPVAAAQFQAHLFRHAAPEVVARLPRAPRRIQGDTGACPSGVVALTFDDGPDRDVTPGLLKTLTRLDVPATFFMVGNRVAAAPRLARRVQEAGFTIANHSFHHDLMTRQSDRAVRRTLRRTQGQLKAAGLDPTRLMRPPYGGIDRRVERTIRGERYVPVLWDVDPRDWEPRSARNIAEGVLSRLRPGASNVVLQHDGVRNSANSARAVPRIVRQARKRGYCFGDLDDRGRAVLPTPTVTASVAATRAGRPARIRLRLNAPSARRTRVRVSTADGTAVAGTHYRAKSTEVVIPAGRTRATVRVRTMKSGLTGRRAGFRVHLTEPKRLRVAAKSARITVRIVARSRG